MTNAKLDEAIAIREKISEYDRILEMLNDDDQYKRFRIDGVCYDGVTDYIDILPDECLEVVRQWYANERMKLKEEFEKM